MIRPILTLASKGKNQPREQSDFTTESAPAPKVYGSNRAMDKTTKVVPRTTTVVPRMHRRSSTNDR